MSKPLLIIVLALVAAAALAQPVHACATCYGAEDSPQTKGMNMAILTMLGVTYTLFAGMVATAFFLWRKARAAAPVLDKSNSTPQQLGDMETLHG